MEKWKDIKGYEGLYRISDQGNVMSLIKNKVMVPKKCGSGYLKVVLCKDKCHKNVMVHRLVAETFILNPEGKRTVNHIDGNKINNSVSNLEWCTYSENLKHAYSHGLNYWSQKKGRPMKAVLMIDSKSGEVLKKYECIGDAVRELALSNGSGIIDVCKGKRKTIAGYKWKYVELNETAGGV